MAAIMATVHVSEQNVYYNEILSDNGYKFKINIRVNSYVFQSRAKIELWTASGWVDIYTVPGELMKTKASYADRKIATSKAFDEDRAQLLLVAKKVVA